MELKGIEHLDSVQLQKGDALLVVDMQNDFMPGGSLAVEKGDAFLSQVNAMMTMFKKDGHAVVFTQDWHPSNHSSFASQHPGKRPFDVFEAPGIGPVYGRIMWYKEPAGPNFIRGWIPVMRKRSSGKAIVSR